MYQSEQINELTASLANAQAKITPAIKDSANTFFKNKYADFASIYKSCVGPLGENGLAIMQIISSENGKPCLITQLSHSSGQWVRSIAPLNPKKDDDQAMGSSISYMKRYSLAALVGVVTEEEDDDGNASVGVTNPEKRNGSHAPRPPGNTISKSLAKELEAMFNKCDKKFQENFMSYMKKSQINSFEMIPEDKYDSYYLSIINKLNSTNQLVTI
jgi:hypothetical protein